MKIIDLNGFAIVVDDLEKAIDFADYFKDAHHIPMVETDKIRQAYWKDIFEKLMELKRASESDLK
ncbi:MAG: hypothetical protein LBV59_11920 [Sphingobacterium sp.]|jgi:hypothetical protein|uniref:hypothetical protein n=1 Tax=Sphingobacterium sp. TaxID=341027 RepID=UPI002847F628|nr:hypothetical protein [Sphingobacterium sp.]MDR3008636.1 hypothetical protein [Sphingobacterium sp.]